MAQPPQTVGLVVSPAVDEVVAAGLWALPRKHGQVVDWVSDRQNHIAGWGKRHRTRGMPGITLVNGRFLNSETLFSPELCKSQSLGGSLIRINRNRKMREKVSEAGWETNILGFIGRTKADWEFLTFRSTLPSFLCKRRRRLPSTENVATIHRKEKTRTQFLLCTKHFAVTIPSNMRTNTRGLAMLSLFYNWEYQPKSPFEQEETLPKSYNWGVKPDNVCDESWVWTLRCPRNWSNILPSAPNCKMNVREPGKIGGILWYLFWRANARSSPVGLRAPFFCWRSNNSSSLLSRQLGIV